MAINDNKILPVFVGGKDKSLANQMLQNVGAEGIRQKVVTSADGTVTRLRTKNGMPEVIVKKPSPPERPAKWSFKYTSLKYDDWNEEYVDDVVTCPAYGIYDFDTEESLGQETRKPRVSNLSSKVRRFGLNFDGGRYYTIPQESRFEHEEGVRGLRYWETDRDYVSWTDYINPGPGDRFPGSSYAATGYVQWGDIEVKVFQPHGDGNTGTNVHYMLCACVSYSGYGEPFLRVATYTSTRLYVYDYRANGQKVGTGSCLLPKNSSIYPTHFTRQWVRPTWDSLGKCIYVVGVEVDENDVETPYNLVINVSDPITGSFNYQPIINYVDDHVDVEYYDKYPRPNLGYLYVHNYYDVACVQVGNFKPIDVYVKGRLIGSITPSDHTILYCADWCERTKELFILCELRTSYPLIGYVFRDGVFYEVHRHPSENFGHYNVSFPDVFSFGITHR